MQSEPREPEAKKAFNAFSREGLAVFSIFFLWDLGTGGLQVARPLFAASFGVSAFFVNLIAAGNSLGRVVSAPIAGYVADRWGRRPLAFWGNIIRGVTTLLQFYCTSYYQYAILEFIGSIGVNIWIVGTSVIIADLTGESTRGRAFALRTMSQRIGAIAGPFIGGVMAYFFREGAGLRSVFMFNVITKIMIHIIIVASIRETRPESARIAATQEKLTMRERLDVRPFLTRAFLVISLVSLTTGLMGQGGAGFLIPVYITEQAHFTTQDVGFALTVAALVGLAVSYPNGWISDRFGRKASLIPGMFVLAGSALALANVHDVATVLLMVTLNGLGTGMASNSAQVQAMDIAPPDRRGAFLGVWGMFNSSAGLITPLLFGLSAEKLGMPTTLMITASLICMGAIVMQLFGPDIQRLRAARAQT